ncbi:transport and Golgi organization protein 6-like isoform X2 [Tetranychus urticae]|uniref:transport and Golgi organization protein 6-like isoform X2 n=1 Tax=Tetranychus urticae TaxID=32264 RepID=UPI00077B9462|nr:transport and Golgi organization protein 6-like isoform X2 [Tetranychus urticae]
MIFILVCLAINTILYETVSPIKRAAKEIVIDILKYVDQSTYILATSIFNLQISINLYSTGLVKIGNEEMLTVIPSNLNYVSVDDAKFLDKTVTAITSILDDLGNEFKLDFFLILVEKVHLSHFNQMVLFSLVDALQEQVSNWILDYPNKAIQFLTNTLRRITSESNDSIQSLMDQEEEQILEKSKLLQMDSLSMLIQIVSILVEAKDKLTSEELLSLKTCNVYLTKVVASELLSKSEQLKIQSLVDEINHLHETTKHSKIDNEDRFAEAVRCLNSNFMPQRAHGLVILRNLIDAQHQSTIDHKSELFTLIKACLSDPDSYVYLAAVNALASLALAHTESCLPTLIEAYHDRDRSVRERVSVGESLVWVCKYLGQLAHHYHRLVVDCFLTGLRDENESIRVSSLSNLGQFCSSLKNALSYCIIEIVCAVECLLKTDSSLDVKRACLMFVYIMLNGIDNAEVILDHLKQIYHIIKSIDSKSLGDDIIRVHAHLALEAIDNLMKKLIKPENDLIRPIKMN